MNRNASEVNDIIREIYALPIHERKYNMKRLREVINGKIEAETITLLNWRHHAKAI